MDQNEQAKQTGEQTVPPRQMTVMLGCDHAAWQFKEKIKKLLNELGYNTQDAGTFGEQSVDYPDYAQKVARAVSEGQVSRAILMCGTGLGMSIAANRFPRVRATLCNDIFSAKMARSHNDSNILVLGARIVGDMLASEIIKTWLNTDFEGGRHLKRINKIDQI